MAKKTERETNRKIMKRKKQHLRKRTLDIGNETIRSIEGGFENFTIDFEFKKVL